MNYHLYNISLAVGIIGWEILGVRAWYKVVKKYNKGNVYTNDIFALFCCIILGLLAFITLKVMEHDFNKSKKLWFKL